MDEIILKFPIRIPVELPGWDATDTNVWSLFMTYFFAPFDTDFGGELGDVLIILKVGPKLDFGTRFQIDYFTNYGDGWRDVSP